MVARQQAFAAELTGEVVKQAENATLMNIVSLFLNQWIQPTQCQNDGQSKPAETI